ncbi:MAG TPA: hypothetical protein VFA43_00390 [Gemmatimonadaceae bacterium]|nr:hypothetical protein [Gemmatimonadaceae bacterium]
MSCASSTMRVAWRIVYRADADAIVIVDVFEKKTRETPRRIVDECRRRLRAYDVASHD